MAPGAWRFRPGHQPSADAAESLAARDLAELSERFGRVHREESGGIEALLLARVQVLGRRGVPVRGLSRGPASGLARLSFGDRSSLIVRGSHPGELGRLAVLAYHHRPVRVLAWRLDPDGIALCLGSNRPHGIDCVAIGLDQSD